MTTPLELMEREDVETAAGIPVMHYHRRGRDASKPLMLFIPGGGHLGRVAYGYPGCKPQDFLDHWLAQAGLGLLAVSAPSGPPFSPAACPDLTRVQWADAIAELADRAIRKDGCLRSVVILAWSMGSGVVGHLALAFRKRDIDVAGFMPLAASTPLPRPSAIQPAEELLLENGLWDAAGSRVFGVERFVGWSAELATAEAGLGRDILSAENYRRHFLTGTPVGLLRGGFSRNGHDSAEPDLTAFPLAAPIMPTDQVDYRQALGDAASWSYMNVQIIMGRYAAIAAAYREIPEEAWRRLLTLVEDLPGHLSARIAGGHLFFIGEQGARATTKAVLTLLERTEAFRKDLDLLLGRVPAKTKTE